MKLVIFSICHNEAETIGQLLDSIPTKIKGISSIETIIISDGSTDGTASIAKQHGADLVIHDQFQKKLAFRFEQAVKVALERQADIAVNIDGDLQFSPADIPKLVAPLLNDSYDFAAADRFSDPQTGKRRRPKNMPVAKYWANRLGARVVSSLSGQKFRDVTCGFRAYNRRALQAININSNYTYTQESFQVLAVKKMNIAAVPVNVQYFKGRKSRVVKSFWQFLFGSALNILRAFRDYAPLRFFGTLGLIAFIPGLFMCGFVLWHWFTSGSISPYKAVGFIGVYLVSVAFVVWALGLVADMFDRMLNNQEKILEKLKETQYQKTKKQ